MPNIINPHNLDYEYLESTHRSKIFEEYHPKTLSSRRYENIQISIDYLTFKLVDKSQKDLMSLISGTKSFYHEIEYFEIEWTFSKNPREGLLSYLFDLIISEFDYKILSDKEHTSPGSKEFWQSLLRRKKFDVYRINLESNYKRKANDFNDDEIWNLRAPEQDELIKDLARLDNLKGFIDPENAFESDNNIELPPSFLIDFEDQIHPIEEVQELIDRHKRRKESKENIRLIAQAK